MEINGIKVSQIKTVNKSAAKNDKSYENITSTCQTTPTFDGQYTPQMFGILPNVKLSKTLNSSPVAFKGSVIKKSDFQGTDLAVIEKFKPNIQQFKSKEDLQTFAESKINELKEKDFGGRQEETRIQRKAMLKEWFDYVTKENDAYSNTQRLVILSAITKDLKPNNDNIPEVLNKGVLAQTVTDLETRLKENPKENFDFHKMYKNNLRTSMMEDTSTGETMTGWVVIPSKENDPENFEKNVEKLKTLSHKNWCTKSFNAEPYLSAGDFHVYLENGQPKLGVRFIDNEVQEIQGEKNDGKIPHKYFDVFKEHQKEYKLKLGNDAKKEVENAEIVKQEIANIKQTLGSAIELNTIDDAIKIFSYAGIKTEKKDNGLVISEYKQPDISYSYEELEIDEKKLFKYVNEIKGNANFSASKVSNLGQLQSIGGDANFLDSNITDLGNLQSIGGNVYSSFNDELKQKIIDNFDILNGINLSEFKKAIKESNTEKILNLMNIETEKDKDGLLIISEYKKHNIEDYFDQLGLNINELFKNIKEIKHSANFMRSKVTNLGNLRSIGGNANFNHSKVTSLGSLQSIGGDAIFSFSSVTDLGYLQSIGGKAHFRNSKITNLGYLQSIGNTALFDDSNVTDLGQLQSIGGDANFIRSKITNLGNLQSIGGNAYFLGSKITDLGQLQSIGKDADFRNSKISIRDISKLKIGGEIKLDDCTAR